jgi:hypothetical protein
MSTGFIESADSVKRRKVSPSRIGPPEMTLENVSGKEG